MVGKINFLRGFLYPLTSPKRLLLSWLVLPVCLAILVPPILLGLGLGSTMSGNAQRLAVGGVCLLTGSLPFTCLAGYMMRCRRRVIAGDAQVLPPWTGIRDLMRLGGKMDVLGIILALPTLLLLGLGLTSLVGPLQNLSSHHTWGAFFLALLGSGAGLLCLLIAFCYWVSVLLLSPMATLRLALGASPLESLSVRGIFRDIGRGWLDYVLCCALVWGISIGFQVLQGAFPPLILIGFPAQVYLQLVWAHLLGQFARAYLQDRCPLTVEA